MSVAPVSSFSALQALSALLALNVQNLKVEWLQIVVGFQEFRDLK
jgi:hypothetical protein